MVGIPKVKRRKMEAFVDLAEGRIGSFGQIRDTEDPKWINIEYFPVNSFKSETVFRVPRDALIHVPVGFTAKMYKHGIYYLIAGEGGAAPILTQKLGADFSTLIRAKNEEIERLSSEKVSAHIQARRAVDGMKMALKDHVDVQKVLKEVDKRDQEMPWLKKNRFSEEP